MQHLTPTVSAIGGLSRGEATIYCDGLPVATFAAKPYDRAKGYSLRFTDQLTASQLTEVCDAVRDHRAALKSVGASTATRKALRLSPYSVRTTEKGRRKQGKAPDNRCASIDLTRLAKRDES